MLLQDLFAAAARRYPQRIAVDVPPGIGRPQRQTLTYAALARMADAIACALAPHVGGESTVAILLPRDTPWLYAAQLGVLQAGAAHVCLDPSFPDAYVDHVLRDSGARVLLSDERSAGKTGPDGPPRIDVRHCASAPASEGSRAPWLTPKSLAYVIYTSGTTGAPKGVLLEHEGVVNLIQSDVARFQLTPEDRIAQGSSPAYDSSIEETWLALAAGAAVVVLDDATVRLGPDLVPWLREERISVLCPPPTLLRAMDCSSPREQLPDLRLCYAGGEAMPQDLADRWAADLWLENGYGPTECTVTVARGRLHTGDPVTIGTPVPGHQALLLDERLQPVAEGETGELCFAGVGLARGYQGQPELTAERFPLHPQFGRLYRTGDLARRADDGRLYCLGRIDAQVKLRGYRIELEAIESALVGCPGVREAACRVQGEGAARLLAAYVVPSEPCSPPNRTELERQLRAVLPAYMVPSRYGELASLPRTLGGKLNRSALPELVAPIAPAAHGDERQLRIAAAFAASVGLRSVGPEENFFAMGGDSLGAAMLITQLRQHPDTAHLAVRDVYETPTVAGLAARAARVDRANPAAAAKGAPTTAGQPLLFTLAQTAWLVGTLVAGSTLAYLVGFELVPWLCAGLGLIPFLLLAPLLGTLLQFCYAAAALWLAVLVKELLIGRYRPLCAPVWGSFHLRHWLVVRTVRLVPWGLLQGTVLQNAALRALGARIGRRVHVHRGVDLLRGGWDLLELGDDATLAQEASVDLVELDQGQWVVGPVRLGAGATLDVRAGAGPHTELGDGAWLGALSHLAEGARVPAGERWDGVPAGPAGPAPVPPPIDVASRTWSPLAHGLLLVAVRTLALPLLALPLTVAPVALLGSAGINADGFLSWLVTDGPGSATAWMAWTVGLAVAALPAALLLHALLLRWTSPAPLGTVSRWSTAYLRIWLRTQVLQAAGNWLSGTLFWPVWLRLAGMRIDARCEVSTILDVLPEHVEVGGESFLADGIYLGAPRLQCSTVTVAKTALGPRTFLGNHVVVAPGQRLPADLLLGVCTPADDVRMAAGGAWFGLPPFRLPRREIVTVDRSLTFAPGPLQFGNRVFWEALRFVLPALPTLLLLLWFDAIARSGSLLMVPVATLAVGLVLALSILILKWLLLGRVRPGQHGLWSCWCSRWDFLYVAWNRYGRALLSPLEGTLLLPCYLRAMGMRIGRRVVLGDGFAQVVDPDMLTIEDGATVHALFQAHSFEDRVLKIDRVRIGAGATVGRGAVLLYGADIGNGAHVAPHSVVMKREHLLPWQHYAGVPTAEVRSAASNAGPGDASGPLPSAPRGRDDALDLARGLAVINMVLLHFVPSPAEDTWHGALAGKGLDALDAKSAGLFAVLIGMSWAIQAARPPDPARGRVHLARRTITLGATGLLLWILVWPTEILLPLALMLPLIAALLRLGTAAVLFTAAALLIAVPWATWAFEPYLQIDLLDNGLHLANSEFGWATLRYFLFDGSYPLLPWLFFPLLGAAMVRADYRSPSRSARWFALALPLAVMLELALGWTEAHRDMIGELAPYLSVTWQPTSVPFVLLVAAWAVTVIAGLSWWRVTAGLPAAARPLAVFGRASLTHYVLHILLVYAPLRIGWPDEDWSFAVGVAATIGYLVLALPLTTLWFRSHARGPLEALMARGSGALV